MLSGRQLLLSLAILALSACSEGTPDPVAPPTPTLGVVLAAAPAQVTADGTATATLTAQVRDSAGTAISAKRVVFTVSGSDNVLSASEATTVTDGTATVTLTSKKAEVKDVSASIEDGALAAHAQVTFTAGGPAAARSTLSGPSAPVVADGVSQATFSLVLVDSNDNPVAGQTVQFEAPGGTLSATSAITGPDGTASVSVTSTIAGAVTVRAIAGAAVLETSTTFTPGAALALALVVQPSGGKAGALFSPAVEVRVVDPAGNVVTSGTVPVTLSLHGGTAGAAIIGSATASTALGVASFPSLSVDKVGTGYTLSAAADGLVSVTSAPFDVGPADPDRSASALTASASSLVVGGSSTLTATVRDFYGNPVPDIPVALESTGASNTLTQPASTDASGSTTGALSSTRAETKTVTALLPGAVAITTTASVAFTPGAPSAATSTLVANPTSVPDDGTSAGLLATVKDQYGNPIAGATVVLSATGAATPVQPAAPTNADGVAEGSVSSLERGAHTITATVGGTAVATAIVTAVAAGPKAENCGIVTSSGSLPADGVSTATVTVTVRDTANRTMSGQTVRLAYGGTASPSPNPATTDGSGIATFTLTSAAATSGTLTATVNPGASEVVVAGPSLAFVPAYRIGGTVAGLDASGSGLVLASPGQDDLAVSPGATTFQFAKRLPQGSTYAVTVVTQPTAPAQTCAVTGGAGTVATADVTSIVVTCRSKWMAVAAGGHHTLALKPDGTLWAWGENSHGQVGNGSTTPQPEPVQIGTGFVSIAAGYMHSLARKGDGSVYSWGYGGEGQLGNGAADRNVPTIVPTPVSDVPDSVFASISAGAYHSLAVKTDGTLWAWGQNASGQLGDTTTTQRNAPVLVGALTDDWTSVSAGYLHTVAVKANGTLWAWGWNGHAQLGNGTASGDADPPQDEPLQIGVDADWGSVAAGGQHTVAVKRNGWLFGWGDNRFGQLGDAAIGDRGYAPARIGTDADWGSVAAGGQHTAGLKTNGTLLAWGYNYYGQLGDGTTTQQNAPAQFGTGFASVSAGYMHTAALSADGTIWTWGDNGSGQLGNGAASDHHSPADVGSGYASIGAGLAFATAVKTDGTLWAWGDNVFGQLGDGTTVQRNTPVPIDGAATYLAAAAGYFHTVAIRTDHTMWAWGDNSYGQLGDGTTNQRSAPGRVRHVPPGPADDDWASVAAGDRHTVAVKMNGSLWSWGDNDSGQLGRTATPVPLALPGQVGTDTNWASVAVGNSHTLAVKTDGTLWAWGDNAFGQLGIAATVRENAPRQVGSDTDWASVAAGDLHSVAVKTAAGNRTLWAWGDNTYGQLGDGTTTDRATPVRIGATPETWASVAAGADHTLAVKADGSAWGWGLNDRGQVGDGTLEDRHSPVPIGTGYARVAAGYLHSLGVHTGRDALDLGRQLLRTDGGWDDVPDAAGAGAVAGTALASGRSFLVRPGSCSAGSQRGSAQRRLSLPPVTQICRLRVRQGGDMRVALAADHAGYALKERLKRHLASRGHEVLDLGAHDDAPSDYPDHAEAAGLAVTQKRAERAILVCGSGVGVAAAANKVPGICAAMCHDHYSAHQGVEHDQMNVLALGARVVGEALALEIADAFLGACFDGEERHARRVAKLRALEARFTRSGVFDVPG